MDQDLVDNVFPSDLIPNATMVLDIFKHDPTTIAFQSTAFPGVVYSKGRGRWMTKLKDLADPAHEGQGRPAAARRHHRRRFLPRSCLRAGQGLQGRRPDEGGRRLGGRQHRPERPQVHARLGRDAAAALQSGAADAVSFWNSLARLEYFGGNTDAALLVPATIYPVNGYLWIPKGAPHPVLAQIFINWRLCQGRPVPERLADRARAVERAERGLPRAGLRRPGPGLVREATTATTSRPSTRSSRTSSRSTGRRTTRAPRSGRTTTPRRSASRLIGPASAVDARWAPTARPKVIDDRLTSSASTDRGAPAGGRAAASATAADGARPARPGRPRGGRVPVLPARVHRPDELHPGQSYLSPRSGLHPRRTTLAMVGRYLPNLLVTLQLAILATLVDLVFGFPFAYILVRKVRYRTRPGVHGVPDVRGAVHRLRDCASSCSRAVRRRRSSRRSGSRATRPCTACRRSSSRWRSSRSRSWS